MWRDPKAISSLSTDLQHICPLKSTFQKVVEEMEHDIKLLRTPICSLNRGSWSLCLRQKRWSGTSLTPCRRSQSAIHPITHRLKANSRSRKKPWMVGRLDSSTNWIWQWWMKSFFSRMWNSLSMLVNKTRHTTNVGDKKAHKVFNWLKIWKCMR